MHASFYDMQGSFVEIQGSFDGAQGSFDDMQDANEEARMSLSGRAISFAHISCLGPKSHTRQTKNLADMHMYV